MKYGFDCDGVICDFASAYEDLLIKQTGVDLFTPHRDDPDYPACWDYPEHYGYTRDEVSAVWDEIRGSDRFWELLYSLPDMGYLSDVLGKWDNDIYFITNRPGVNAKRQTENWLRSYGVPNATVLISDKKGFCSLALGLDFYVDDKLENANDAASTSSAYVYLLDRPYNQGSTRAGVTRVKSLRQAFEDFKGKREPWGAG